MERKSGETIKTFRLSHVHRLDSRARQVAGDEGRRDHLIDKRGKTFAKFKLQRQWWIAYMGITVWKKHGKRLTYFVQQPHYDFTNCSEKVAKARIDWFYPISKQTHQVFFNIWNRKTESTNGHDIMIFILWNFRVNRMFALWPLPTTEKPTWWKWKRSGKVKVGWTFGVYRFPDCEQTIAWINTSMPCE